MAKAKFIGVYTTSGLPSGKGLAVPQGTTANHQKQYWFAWQDGWGRFRVQPLDAAFQPLESPRIIAAGEFESYYVHQPRILVTPVTQLEVSPPEEEESKHPIKAGETTELFDFSQKPEKKSEPLSENSETDLNKKELERAIKKDKQLRSDFSVALAKYRRGDRKNSLKVFEDLCTQKEGILPEHKHTFTDFAIDLRKSRLTDLARRHCQRAIELAPDDSNAHFNMARIYFEMGNLQDAEKQLNIALKLNPDFEYASQFLQYLQKRKASSTPLKKIV